MRGWAAMRRNFATGSQGRSMTITRLSAASHTGGANSVPENRVMQRLQLMLRQPDLFFVRRICP
jgi:hypothetical protein